MRTSSDLAGNAASARAASLPPGPGGPAGLVSAFTLFRDPLRTLLAARRRFGDTIRFRAGPFNFIAIHQPDDIRHVLVGNHNNYPKSRNYDGLRLVLGQGLVTSEGELWRRQRRLAQPAFHRERLAAFFETMAECTEDRLRGWDAGPDGRRVDIHREMMDLTFRIVGRTLFSIELGQHDAVGPAITVALHYANDYVESVFPIPPWVPTPANLRFRRALRALDGMVASIIATRHRAPDEKTDLLSMLMAATDETGGEGMSDRQLRDEVLTLALAGHETTANALSWAFYLLGQHPEVDRRLHAETVEVLGDRSPRLEDLPRLAYTRCVVDEVLRLYPPAWMIERQAIEEDRLGGHRIPRGSIVGISPWSIHRHPGRWERPDEFDPGRFAGDRAREQDRYAYLPFGGGARTCIGNHFALMEATLLVALIARRYRLELDPGHPIVPEAGITLRPAHGIGVFLRRRA